MTQSFKQRCCGVCGKSIPNWLAATPHAAGKLSIPKGVDCCNSFECGNILNKHQTMSTPQFAAHLAYHQKRIKNRQADAEKEEKRQAQLKELEAEENSKEHSQRLKKNGVTEAEYPLLPIPSCHSTLVPVSDARRNDFLRHLNKIIEQAIAPDFSPSDDDKSNRDKCAKTDTTLSQHPRLQEINTEACIRCRGGCCTQGVDHAYLVADTLYSVMINKKIENAEDLRHLYLENIPDQSIENSCIFHTEMGCAQPRELRSVICNAYLCDGIKQYNASYLSTLDCDEKGTEASAESGPKGAVILARNLDNWKKNNHCGNNQIIAVDIYSFNENL